MRDLSRRGVIGLVGGAAASCACWPVGARAQPAPMPLVGYLNDGLSSTNGHLEAAFREGLKDAGYVEGRNVAIEYRWAESQYDRLPALAADLVGRQVAVVVASGSPRCPLAVKAATSTIPIIFDSNDDPVKLGLVASFNRPGGNATGVSFFTAPLDAKRLELLHDLLPKATVVGVLINPDSPSAARVLPEIQEVARVIGLQLQIVKANIANDIEAAFATLSNQRAEALLVSTDPFFTISRDRLAALAARHAIPAVYGRREFVAAGGLISYGEPLIEAYRQMGLYAGKILNGAKPADLPVMQLTKVELVININTAKALGLEVPSTLLARADEVIE